MQTYHNSKIVLKTNISVFTSLAFNDVPIQTGTNDSLRNKNTADIPISDQIRLLGKYY